VLLEVSLLSDVSFVGVLSVSVGVSAVVGELIFRAAYGVRSLFVHSSRMRVRFAGVLAVDEAATRSSEDRFVCANDGDVTI
jgi:hypothetical protein